MKHYDFCSQKKKSSLFEVVDVLPVMTNNFEDTIMKGVQVLGVFLYPPHHLPLTAFPDIPSHIHRVVKIGRQPAISLATLRFLPPVTWETHIPTDMHSPTWETISLVICVPYLGNTYP